ncbi:MAG: hypothetical protein K2Y37_23100 [Pirellulales bacterium]|nr:hypothetical protein [Pirellulales bacterium]
MNEPLIPPRFLFRVSAPCRYRNPPWPLEKAPLDDQFRLPDFELLDGGRALADVRAAWSEAGLVFAVRVAGKRTPVRCDEGRYLQSDAVHFWIDTRHTYDVHRASRFCHRFYVLPTGGGRRRDEPVVEQLMINRAREDARRVRPGELKARSERRVDGYLAEVFFPATALGGFDPVEHPRLGFTFAVFDHELGTQTFASGGQLPYDDDPSTWGTLELVR